MIDRIRIGITGSRRMKDPLPIRMGFFDFYHSRTFWDEWTLDQVVIVHGAGPGADGAPGCDALADAFFREHFPEVAIEPHPAENFGAWPECGPLRNTHMVGLGALLWLAFPCPRSRGTHDTIEKALHAGQPVRIYPVQP